MTQGAEKIVKVELIDARGERELFDGDYDEYILYTLKTEEIQPFIEKLESLEFRIPMLEPVRILGDLAVWIYYEDGRSDLIGMYSNWSFDAEYNTLVRGVEYLNDNMAFHTLFCEYVDPALLPAVKTT